MPARGSTAVCAFVECQKTFTVTFGAEKYCSVACRNTAWARRGQALRKTTRTPVVVTYRACLRCDHVFKSSGCGNRICPTCKDSGEWREGDTAEQAFQRGAGTSARIAWNRQP